MSIVVLVRRYVAETVYLVVFKQKTAYEMRISDWSSDVCSADLLWIEAADDKRDPVTLTTTEENARTFAPGGLRRFAAGGGEAGVILICGYFRATYGASIDLFRTLTSPIVEQFSETDQLDHRLSSAMGELVAQEVGTGAMTAALMKQVLVKIGRAYGRER